MKVNLDEILTSSVFAEEALVVDVQSLLHHIMEKAGLSRADLARRMGVSRARVTQMFSDDCPNLTLRLVARAFHALGEVVELTCQAEREHVQHQNHEQVKEAIRACDNVVMGTWNWESHTPLVGVVADPVTAPEDVIERAFAFAAHQSRGLIARRTISREKKKITPEDWFTQADQYSSELAVING